jgi:hypothetical protein
MVRLRRVSAKVAYNDRLAWQPGNHIHDKQLLQNKVEFLHVAALYCKIGWSIGVRTPETIGNSLCKSIFRAAPTFDALIWMLEERYDILATFIQRYTVPVEATQPNLAHAWEETLISTLLCCDLVFWTAPD